MKKILIITVLVLTVCLVTACLFVSGLLNPLDAALTVNGEIVNEEDISAVETMLITTYAESQIDSESETAREHIRQQAIEQIVRDVAVKQYIKEEGLEAISEDEYKVLYAAADEAWEVKIQEYLTNFSAYVTDERAEKTFREMAEAYFATQGYTYETLVSQMEDYYRSQHLYNSLMDGIEFSEEEIEAYFTERVTQDMGYASDIATYEHLKYNGREMLYTPEGYRDYLGILLPVDDKLTALYTSAQNEEETQRIQQSILTENKEVLDEIYEKLDGGEDFRNLMLEYGTDEDKNDKMLSEGVYRIHRESIIYPKKFIEVCFEGGMMKQGDYSDAFVTEYGIHILYYLRDVPAAAVEMTDEVKLILYGEMVDAKVSEKYEELSNRLYEKAVVEYRG